MGTRAPRVPTRSFLPFDGGSRTSPESSAVASRNEQLCHSWRKSRTSPPLPQRPKHWNVCVRGKTKKEAVLSSWSGKGHRAFNRVPFFISAIPHPARSEEHTSELQSRPHLVCRLLLEKKKKHRALLVTAPSFRALKMDVSSLLRRE